MTGYEWLSRAVTVAILAGFSSVILVMLLGQSRVFYSMSRDGLVPKIFSEVHPKFRTPYKSNMLFFVFTALFARVRSRRHRRRDDQHRDAVRVHARLRRASGSCACAGRTLQRGFTVPMLPVVAVLGIVVCGAMIFGLGWTNWLRLRRVAGAWAGHLLRLRAAAQQAGDFLRTEGASPGFQWSHRTRSRGARPS